MDDESLFTEEEAKVAEQELRSIGVRFDDDEEEEDRIDYEEDEIQATPEAPAAEAAPKTQEEQQEPRGEEEKEEKEQKKEEEEQEDDENVVDEILHQRIEGEEELVAAEEAEVAAAEQPRFPRQEAAAAGERSMGAVTPQSKDEGAGASNADAAGRAGLQQQRQQPPGASKAAQRGAPGDSRGGSAPAGGPRTAAASGGGLGLPRLSGHRNALGPGDGGYRGGPAGRHGSSFPGGRHHQRGRGFAGPQRRLNQPFHQIQQYGCRSEYDNSDRRPPHNCCGPLLRHDLWQMQQPLQWDVHPGDSNGFGSYPAGGGAGGASAAQHAYHYHSSHYRGGGSASGGAGPADADGDDLEELPANSVPIGGACGGRTSGLSFGDWRSPAAAVGAQGGPSRGDPGARPSAAAAADSDYLRGGYRSQDFFAPRAAVGYASRGQAAAPLPSPDALLRSSRPRPDHAAAPPWQDLRWIMQQPSPPLEQQRGIAIATPDAGGGSSSLGRLPPEALLAQQQHLASLQQHVMLSFLNGNLQQQGMTAHAAAATATPHLSSYCPQQQPPLPSDPPPPLPPMLKTPPQHSRMLLHPAAAEPQNQQQQSLSQQLQLLNVDPHLLLRMLEFEAAAPGGGRNGSAGQRSIGVPPAASAEASQITMAQLRAALFDWWRDEVDDGTAGAVGGGSSSRAKTSRRTGALPTLDARAKQSRWQRQIRASGRHDVDYYHDEEEEASPPPPPASHHESSRVGLSPETFAAVIRQLIRSDRRMPGSTSDQQEPPLPQVAAGRPSRQQPVQTTRSAHTPGKRPLRRAADDTDGGTVHDDSLMTPNPKRWRRSAEVPPAGPTLSKSPSPSPGPGPPAPPLLHRPAHGRRAAAGLLAQHNDDKQTLRQRNHHLPRQRRVTFAAPEAAELPAGAAAADAETDHDMACWHADGGALYGSSADGPAGYLGYDHEPNAAAEAAEAAAAYSLGDEEWFDDGADAAAFGSAMPLAQQAGQPKRTLPSPEGYGVRRIHPSIYSGPETYFGDEVVVGGGNNNVGGAVAAAGAISAGAGGQMRLAAVTRTQPQPKVSWHRPGWRRSQPQPTTSQPAASTAAAAVNGTSAAVPHLHQQSGVDAGGHNNNNDDSGDVWLSSSEPLQQRRPSGLQQRYDRPQPPAGSEARPIDGATAFRNERTLQQPGRQTSAAAGPAGRGYYYGGAASNAVPPTASQSRQGGKAVASTRVQHGLNSRSQQLQRVVAHRSSQVQPQTFESPRIVSGGHHHKPIHWVPPPRSPA